jgi:hypothetical protein
MTPMTRLKNNLDTLTMLIEGSFKEVNLNKSSPKEFYTSWCGEVTHNMHRGVESDFIKIFNPINKSSYSMAFIFDYINLPEEDQRIQYTIKNGEPSKTNDYIISSEKMTVNEFKEKLNLVNVQLKENTSLNDSKIIEAIANQFIPGFSDKVKITSSNNVTKIISYAKTQKPKMK